MNGSKAGASLDSLMSSFNARITQLQELVIARNSEFPSIHFNFISNLQVLTPISVSINRRFLLAHYTVYPASSIADLSAVDAAVSAMELQVKVIKDRLREETRAIPKTKALSSHSSFIVSMNAVFVFFI